MITAAYIAEILGVSTSVVTANLIALAEAEAADRIGYFSEEEVSITKYMFEPTYFIDLPLGVSSLTKLEYRTSATTEYTEILSGTYRFIPASRIIKLDTQLAAETDVVITYTRGWTINTVPTTVKFLVVLLVGDLLRRFSPGTLPSGVISEKRIVDLQVKYKLSSSSDRGQSLEGMIDALVTLIKQGPTEPTSEMQ